MPHWDDIRVFLAAARAESLSRAAPVLRVDAATVGRRITRLERETGAALFVKSPQGQAFTDLGARMRDYAAQAEAALSLAVNEARDEAGRQAGDDGADPHRRAGRGGELSVAAGLRQNRSRQSGAGNSDSGAAARR